MNILQVRFSISPAGEGHAFFCIPEDFVEKWPEHVSRNSANIAKVVDAAGQKLEVNENDRLSLFTYTYSEVLLMAVDPLTLVEYNWPQMSGFSVLFSENDAFEERSDAMAKVHGAELKEALCTVRNLFEIEKFGFMDVGLADGPETDFLQKSGLIERL